MGFFSRLFGKPKSTTGDIRSRKNEADVYNVETENERMNWMIEKAGLTLHHFEDSLKSPRPNQDHFSVKVRFEEGDKVEHIWLSDPHFDDDGNLFGSIGNTPIDMRNVHLGQKVGIDRSFISDWMIIEQGRLIGGYTIRAVRDGVPENKRSQFDKSIGGLFVDEGEDCFPVNGETPEGALLAIEEAYSEGNIEKAMTFKSFEHEAKVMMQKLDTPEEPELIGKMAEVLKLSFIKSLQEHPLPNFDGVRRAFPTRQKVTDDHYIITEVCFYPDNTKSIQKMNTFFVDGQWKVGTPVE